MTAKAFIFVCFIARALQSWLVSSSIWPSTFTCSIVLAWAVCSAWLLYFMILSLRSVIIAIAWRCFGTEASAFHPASCLFSFTLCESLRAAFVFPFRFCISDLWTFPSPLPDFSITAYWWQCSDLAHFLYWPTLGSSRWSSPSQAFGCWLGTFVLLKCTHFRNSCVSILTALLTRSGCFSATISALTESCSIWKFFILLNSHIFLLSCLNPLSLLSI